jgi:uncharacterized protein (TIGR03435 family)
MNKGTGLRKLSRIALGGLLLAGCTALGQAVPAKLAFDVASIRPSAALDPVKMQADMQAGKMPKFGPRIDASRAEYSYMSLKELIANAYGVKMYQVTGPDWLVTQRFDIMATMPDGSSKDDAPKMLQSLLAERFKLEAHRDSQEHPVLGLVVGKGGPKMKESTGTLAPIDEDAPLKPGEMKMDTPEGPARITRNSDGSSTVNLGAKGIITQRMDAQTQTLHLESTMVTMDGFAEMLTNIMTMGGGGGKQVVDMTDLKGNYQVAVDVSLADLMAMMRAQGMNMPWGGGGAGGGGTGPAAASDPAGGSTVFESVQKLGLKLEQRKAKVEQVVVDHAEKTPTEN